MILSLLLKGWLIGLSVAATVGPMSLLCIQRTLIRGFRTGLLSGVGVATADMCYGSLAAFGLSLVTQFLVSQHFWMHVLGGCFLLYLGLKAVLSTPAKSAAVAQERGILSTYLSTFLLTLTNPLTILSFAAIFAGAGLSEAKGDYIAAGILVLGVFIGSLLWWLVLTTIVSLFRTRFDQHITAWINRISGLIIVSFGVFSIASPWFR